MALLQPQKSEREWKDWEGKEESKCFKITNEFNSSRKK